MDPAALITWRTAVAETVGSVMAGFEERYGYPPGRNLVEGPDDLGAGRLGAVGSSVPRDLLQLYGTLGAVSLPDIGNGLFLHHAGLVADAYEAQELRHVTGRYQDDVIVFGSDGGGTVYALASPGGSPVYRMPAGSVVGGVYESDSPGFRIVATDLAGFLALVRRAVELFAATGKVPSL
jgi:hypothetical protein